MRDGGRGEGRGGKALETINDMGWSVEPKNNGTFLKLWRVVNPPGQPS